MGDLLICAGDICSHGTLNNAIDFMAWFADQPHQHKVFIAGNHDKVFEVAPDRVVVPHGIHYLNDSGVTIEGLNIWGSPVQPRFLDWSFNRDRGAAIQAHWDLIPTNTHILVTHGPAMGYLDLIMPSILNEGRDYHQGCANLRLTIDERLRELRLHVFGHLHYQGCQTEIANGVTYVNAAVVDDGYSLRGEIQVVDIPSP